MRNLHCVGFVILITASCFSSKVIQPFSILREKAKRTETVPAPLVIPPSQYFQGVDGTWSTFFVRVGTPPQSMQVIASTNSPDTIIVRPEGCLASAIPGGVPSDCVTARGGTFNSNLSTTWSDQGWYSLNGAQYGFEANLDYHFNLDYGVDKLGLGFDGDSPVLENQTVAGYNLPNPLYVGLFGLGTQPVIYSTFGDFSAPSYFVTLRNRSLIPSLSWSYTAGASYRFSAGQFAQLIFGGYDISRYQPNDVDFTLSADVTRDIVVGIQSISYSGESVINLLPEPIYAFIESTDPNIWLPLSACLLFEQAFALHYDNATEKYLMNTTQFTALSATNPSVSFTLASTVAGGSTVDITLPFLAFGLKAAYPFVQNSTYYFPLKRAENSTQYTLGRTFLQEAYLTVDYEKGNFSVSQCTWVAGAKAQILPILSASYATNNTNGTSPTGPTTQVPARKSSITPILGGVLGGMALLSVSVALLWFRRRKHQKSKEQQSPDSVTKSLALQELKPPDVDKIFCAEEVSGKGSMYKKSPGSVFVERLADGNEIYQLSAETKPTEMDSSSIRYELDGISPVILAAADRRIPGQGEGSHSVRTGEQHLSPLGDRKSSGSVASTSRLLPKDIQPSPGRPLLSSRIESFAALEDPPVSG